MLTKKGHRKSCQFCGEFIMINAQLCHFCKQEQLNRIELLRRRHKFYILGFVPIFLGIFFPAFYLSALVDQYGFVEDLGIMLLFIPIAFYGFDLHISFSRIFPKHIKDDFERSIPIIIKGIKKNKQNLIISLLT